MHVRSTYGSLPTTQSTVRLPVCISEKLQHRAQPLNITNDILWGMENQEITTMLILDILVAFDTVDHDILLTIMEITFGFKAKILQSLH